MTVPLWLFAVVMIAHSIWTLMLMGWMYEQVERMKRNHIALQEQLMFISEYLSKR